MDDDIRNRFRSRPSTGRDAYIPPRRPVVSSPRQSTPHIQPQQSATPPPPPEFKASAQPVRRRSQPIPEVVPLASRNRPEPVEMPFPTPEPIIQLTEPKKPKFKKFSRKRLLIFVLILLIGLGAGGYYFLQKKKSQDNKTPIVSQQQTIPKAQGSIRFIASGDNYTFDSINAAAKKPDGSYDYSNLFSGVKPFYDKAEIKFCNESVPAAGTTIGVSGFPSFNAPPAFAKGLGDLGCNLINLGSKNINDKGQAGIDATVSYWDNQPEMLAVAGANRSAIDQTKIRYFTVKDVKFAFLSYTVGSNSPPQTPHGVNIYNDQLMQSQTAEARKNAHLVVVAMSWGNEDSNDINPDQERIAQALADQNVDIVIGSGAHAVQPAKILDGKDKHQTLVWFNLGNMLNSQVPINNLVGGIAVMDFDLETQNLKNPSFLPIYMHYEWTAEQKKRQSQPDLLARHDFALMPLDKAADKLAKSQNGTTVEAQTERIKGIVTKFAPIKMITSTEYLGE